MLYQEPPSPQADTNPPRKVLLPVLIVCGLAIMTVACIGIVDAIHDESARFETADQLRHLPRDRWVNTLASERYPNELLKLLGDGYVYKGAGASYPIVEVNGKAAEVIWVITSGSPNKLEKYKRVSLNSP